MLTVVIPAAPYHRAIVQQAVASVEAQTLRCAAVVVNDDQRRGAGWARNEGLKGATTPFVAFLDADDLLDPAFAEATLRAYDGRRYVYTDWITDKVIEAPACPWNGKGAAHIVTTLLPTAWVRFVGGFDEALLGGEDTDFYWKLTRAGLCGKRLNQPLVQYRKGGQRAAAFVNGSHFRPVMREIVARYERLPMTCTDCGGNVLDIPQAPSGEHLPDDVLAETLWRGSRPERGHVSGRIYRGGWNERIWMDARDIDAAPHLFARVIDMPPPPSEDDFRAFANTVMRSMGAARQSAVPVPEPAPAVYGTQGAIRPNVQKVLSLYQQAANV